MLEFCLFIHEEQIISQNNMLSLEKAQKFFSKYASKAHCFIVLLLRVLLTLFRVPCRGVTCSELTAQLGSDKCPLGKRKSSLLLTVLLAGPSWSQLEPGLTI